MGKIKHFFRNMSLKNSIAFYIILFALLAGILANLTTFLCNQKSNAILMKYRNTGYPSYTQKIPAYSEHDMRLMLMLDIVPTIAIPMYAVLAVAAASVLFYRRKLKVPLEI